MDTMSKHVPAGPPYVPKADSRDIENEAGVVHINNSVIAVIARIAASKVAGVVDFVGGLADGLAGIVGKRASDRGVRVELVDNSVVIELNVVLEYGVAIPRVAWEIQQEVRRNVEQMTGKSVKAVNVIVQSVRLPGEGKGGAADAESREERT
jgi:uncharacterized alkaline shock family protein YloU